MFDTNDDAKGGFRRVEILTGPGRRRRWSAEDKSRIIAETLVPGARVSEVARHWQLSSQQVFGWRRAARLAMTIATTRGPIATGFIPIVTEAGPATPVPQTTAPVIEVRLAGAVVRVPSGVDDAAQLTVVLRAIRASASKS
jgi:transposase